MGLTAILCLASLGLSGCMQRTMRSYHSVEGADFKIYDYPDSPLNPSRMSYSGATNKLNQAHGFGTYTKTWPGMDAYGSPQTVTGKGTFKNGLPVGKHATEVQAATTFHGEVTYDEQGNYVSSRKISGSVLAEITAGAAKSYQTDPKFRSDLQKILGDQSGWRGSGESINTTAITANYPEGFAYNVTTYVGTSANVPWDFATIYGVTSYQTARQYIEAGKAIYGGDKSDRPGWFWIEKVPVRAGTNVKVGIQGVR